MTKQTAAEKQEQQKPQHSSFTCGELFNVMVLIDLNCGADYTHVYISQTHQTIALQ